MCWRSRWPDSTSRAPEWNSSRSLSSNQKNFTDIVEQQQLNQSETVNQSDISRLLRRIVWNPSHTYGHIRRMSLLHTAASLSSPAHTEHHSVHHYTFLFGCAPVKTHTHTHKKRAKRRPQHRASVTRAWIKHTSSTWSRCIPPCHSADRHTQYVWWTHGHNPAAAGKKKKKQKKR